MFSVFSRELANIYAFRKILSKYLCLSILVLTLPMYSGKYICPEKHLCDCWHGYAKQLQKDIQKWCWWDLYIILDCRIWVVCNAMLRNVFIEQKLFTNIFQQWFLIQNKFKKKCRVFTGNWRTTLNKLLSVNHFPTPRYEQHKY